jgi:transposase
MAPEPRCVTGGVDTHADVHVAAALDSATGRLLGTESFSTTAAGYAALTAWLCGFGVLDRVGVESTGSWGAGLARHLRSEEIEVIEVDRPDRKARRFEGKSDPTDAVAAARAVVSGRASGAAKTKDGLVEAIRALEVVYHGSVKDRTRAINQFKALLVTAPEVLRGNLRPLALSAQLARARRLGPVDDVVEAETRLALRARRQDQVPRRPLRPPRGPHR